MRLKSLVFYFFLLLIFFGFTVYQAILDQKIKEQILSFIIAFFGSIIFEVMKKRIFSKIIESKPKVMDNRVKIIMLLEKIKDYESFANWKNKIINDNNHKYFQELVMFFYLEHEYDISRFNDINNLLNNKKIIIEKILLETKNKKERTYKKLNKSFKIIKKGLNYDSEFTSLFYKFKNHILFETIENNVLTIFLAVISIIGFAFTLTIAILNVEPIVFFRTFALYFFVIIFLQSFIGIIEYDSEYHTEINCTKKIIETLSVLEEMHESSKIIS